MQVRPYDADAITRIQIQPPPLPISWGRTVQPYVPQQARSRPQAAEAAQLNSTAHAFERTYQACHQLALPVVYVMAIAESLYS